MRKKFLFAVLPIFLLACNFLFPISRQDKNPLPATVGPAANQSTPESFVIVRINKASGDMMTQLASEAEKAKALGLAPFIEFDATWCPPCQAIEKSIEAKDPLTMRAFEGVYLIRADVDEWNSENGKDFTFDAIPVYYQLDAGGYPTGSVIDGGAWNEDIPQNFAPVLDAFFHSK